MADIQLLDVSIRDGNQSLWGATGLATRQILQIAPVLDRVGFRAADFTSSTHMGVAVRTHREDPWERIRLTHAAMPRTPLQFIGSGLRFISWESVHPDVMQLAYDRLVAAGISRFVVLDPMHDMTALLRSALMIRRAGAGEIIAALTFTISDAHDDSYYAGLAAQLAAAPDIDRAYVKDPAGLLAPERARTLIPAIRAQLGGKALELHSHAVIGLSPLTYLAAADLGVQVLQIACGALANGTSLPDAQRLVANLRELGHTADVDDRLLAATSDYFTALARAEGLPPGVPQQYDASFIRHQVAGGVMTTMRRQLAELGLESRFDEVMDEVSQVRAELGYPIMVTPFPQMVCSQALYNVIGDERYANVSDQLIRYVLGSFGRPAVPVAPAVADRILSRPRNYAPSRRPRRPPNCAGASRPASGMRNSCSARRCQRTRWTRCSPPAPRRGTTTPASKASLTCSVDCVTQPRRGRPRCRRPRCRASSSGSRASSSSSGARTIPGPRMLADQRAAGPELPGDVAERLRAVAGFVLDLDGTLVLGDARNHRLAPLPGALSLTSWLTQRDVPYVILTNGTTRTPRQYAQTLREIGFGLADDAVLTPATSAARLLRRNGHRRVLALGTDGLAGPLLDAGLEVVRPEQERAGDDRGEHQCRADREARAAGCPLPYGRES